MNNEKSEESESSYTTVVDATLEMPEDSQLSVAIYRRRGVQKIPFRALLEKNYMDGTKALQIVKGVYEGVTVSEVMIYFEPIKFLNAESRYEDSPGLIFKKDEHHLTWKNLGSDDNYLPDFVKKELSIWGASSKIEEGYCSIGDVAVQGYDYPEVAHYLVSAKEPGALVKPIGFFEEWDDTGSGVKTM